MWDLLSNKLVELKGISSLQVAEESAQDDEMTTTLQSNGTTKFGQKFAS